MSKYIIIHSAALQIIGETKAATLSILQSNAIIVVYSDFYIIRAIRDHLNIMRPKHYSKQDANKITWLFEQIKIWSML